MVITINNKTGKPVVLKIFAIILIQSLLLVLMIASRQVILSSETVVILETQPIEPRSLFRGDYVRLNYEINELQLDELAGDKIFKTNDIVYIVLQKKDLYWKAQSVVLKKPDVENKHQVFIRGVIKRVTNRQWNPDLKSRKDTTSIRVSYGIENYFVPEGEGIKFERPEAGDKVTLEIALDGEGNAAIKSLLLNGVKQYEETLF
ncbi:MAG: GDYXXLXY domain-containing protein [gamma proteobacterium symbiont of Bathyaustriella thionipta]|nr:GDYXXLXY domain-containing protein [gamma proteobacterium symbiont of Bathyaustriella thionipta]MCU7951245.1 GDYXXLXY domain-containing protein [gamma proteobacterium symbiont of Bathyaustriella thionipta]MCU7953400.1 GDYXXLXY domain-containing protein [gamma proteobacterium symbiont of Bathyaustriella thionipta]MCU7957771.1 GDYXXLXY domain-containing protein [gamma proteobacterium symbiont of Bathyaustriella thionipta]MCU7966142.1 GDYXXLXY domain-containing protein [gamma proteobacterium sy